MKKLTRKQASSISGGLACRSEDYYCPGNSYCCISNMRCMISTQTCKD
ncbi:hypothetical protein [Elizabethkingia ursingii]|nr:hypothetical protein [Elizabethkingia ursingii]